MTVHNPIVSAERLHTGGLMPCCTATWDQEMATARGWKDDDSITCRYTDDDPSHRMIREDGVWSWAMPEMDA